MNNKQKQKRTVLAIALAILLAFIVAISAAISCGTSRCAGSQPANTQSKSDVIVSEILVSNKQTVRDPLGTYSDYVELFNKSVPVFIVIILQDHRKFVSAYPEHRAVLEGAADKPARGL